MAPNHTSGAEQSRNGESRNGSLSESFQDFFKDLSAPVNSSSTENVRKKSEADEVKVPLPEPDEEGREVVSYEDLSDSSRQDLDRRAYEYLHIGLELSSHDSCMQAKNLRYDMLQKRVQLFKEYRLKPSEYVHLISIPDEALLAAVEQLLNAPQEELRSKLPGQSVIAQSAEQRDVCAQPAVEPVDQDENDSGFNFF